MYATNGTYIKQKKNREVLHLPVILRPYIGMETAINLLFRMIYPTSYFPLERDVNIVPVGFPTDNNCTCDSSPASIRSRAS